MSSWPTIALGLVALVGCQPELCAPVPTRFSFFSQGDCVLARASFFQGHEWITHFANADMDEQERFSEAEELAIAEGNRRVDWPKELLVHLNGNVVAYARALTEYTDRPENQRLHFLLSDRNTSPEAVQEALAELRRISVEALATWSSNRERALALIGRANHVLQDSFSTAHVVRDPEQSFCIVKVKAYIERAPGHLTPDIEFHGATDDTFGHTTSEDSIYREGRDCREPTTAQQVEGCLNDQAQRARLATRDYFVVMRQSIARYVLQNPASLDAERALEPELETYFRQHFTECSP